jgi:hypothetical protein
MIAGAKQQSQLRAQENSIKESLFDIAYGLSEAVAFLSVSAIIGLMVLAFWAGAD